MMDFEPDTEMDEIIDDTITRLAEVDAIDCEPTQLRKAIVRLALCRMDRLASRRALRQTIAALEKPLAMFKQAGE